MTNKTSVVVVGGGLAGLVAATLLARRGAAVRLFESAETLGGRAQTEEQDGFSFNLGPHALYVKGEATRVLRELDVTFTGHLPAAHGLFAGWGGELHVLPAAPASLLRTTLLGFREKLQVARLLAARRETSWRYPYDRSFLPWSFELHPLSPSSARLGRAAPGSADPHLVRQDRSCCAGPEQVLERPSPQRLLVVTESAARSRTKARTERLPTLVSQAT